MYRNYQNELDAIIQKIDPGEVPSLLLHACCAPCSSHCLRYLSDYFTITVFFFNPNIAPLDEYRKRRDELYRLLKEMPTAHKATLLEGQYDPEAFYRITEGLRDCKEGGERCERCFGLRLEESAKVAKDEGIPYFTTTLTISPHKDAEKINKIGHSVSKENGVLFLPSDFKKKDGYRQSVELSKQYRLYRQNYCGCIFSKEVRK